MNYLLDTHTVIWFLNDDPHLSKAAEEAITSPTAHNHVSIASLWEVGIKMSIHKFDFEGGFSAFCDLIRQNGFKIIHLEQKYIQNMLSLPLIHRDPFDRIIVSTALCEDMTILTADENISKYKVTSVW
ncbi:MAG: type II toxin-antitoxin system VapC family toxin [Oscillospiraceae bacterium]|jgi:PIN domain nuclease of toxin-antitoxin system|nr:type II toxin-antitoxin system VapC family toxin [Oscillospiraceae bacterium]